MFTTHPDGSLVYSSPDSAIPYVQVVHTAYKGQLRSGGLIAVPAGLVQGAKSMGATNAATEQTFTKNHAWIPHPTAKVLDVLPESEVAAGVAATVAQTAAVKAYWTARQAAARAQQATAPAVAPLSAAEVTALRAMLKPATP